LKLAKDLYLVGSGGVGISHPTDAHIYLIDGHGEMALIDTGSGVAPERILANVRSDGLDPSRITAVLTTHAHLDHAGSHARIKRATGCKIGINPHGVQTLEKDLWPGHPALTSGFAPETVKVDFTFTEGNVIRVGDYEVTCVHTPGHSVDSTCFVATVGGLRALFTGDTLSGEGHLGVVSAETDFVGYRNHLRRVLAMKPEALLPGHHMFSLAHAERYIEHSISLLEGRWSGFQMGSPAFYPSWWFTHFASTLNRL